MEKSLNPVAIKVENSLTLRLITAMKDSSGSVISSSNQRNEEERSEAKPEQLSVSDCNDKETHYDPTQTSDPTKALPGYKEDTFYMQIMQSSVLSHMLFVPCGENG